MKFKPKFLDMYIKIFNFANAKLIYTHSIYMKKYLLLLMCICLCSSCYFEYKYKKSIGQEIDEDTVEAAFLAEEDWEDDWEEEIQKDEEEIEENIDDIEVPELSDPDTF